jgi:hypothetical protein
MRISGIGAAAIGPTPRRTATRQREPQTAETESRALIAIAPAAQAERSWTQIRRPAAPFLAHLIATQMQAPQTRVRRRAEPEDATTAYAAAKVATPARRTFGKLA